MSLLAVLIIAGIVVISPLILAWMFCYWVLLRVIWEMVRERMEKN